MTLVWQLKAKEDYLSLPDTARKKAHKAFRLFVQNPWHPSLHTEKIDDKNDIWSARIDRNCRFTFQWVQDGIVIRRMGSHRKAYRKS